MPAKHDPADKAWAGGGGTTSSFRYTLGCNAGGDFSPRASMAVSSPFDAPGKTPDLPGMGRRCDHRAEPTPRSYFPMFKSGDFDLLDPQV